MNKDEIGFYKKFRYLKTPKLFQIELTNRCPLVCPQCYKTPNGGEDIDFHLLHDILKDAFLNKIKYIMLNGGEPLLYDNFIELLFLIKKYDFSASCVTSGINLSDHFIQAMQDSEAALELNISLNGSTKEINELSRDGYEEAMVAIELLVKHNFDFGLNWVARKDNVRDFPNIVNLAKQHNIKGITVVTSKMDWAGRNLSNLEEEDYQFLASFIDKYDDRQYITVQNCYPFLNMLLKTGVNKNRAFCGAGIFNCVINTKGMFMPCIHLDYKENYSSITDYWHNSEVLKKIRNAKFGDYEECRSCKKNIACKNCFCILKRNHDTLTRGMNNCPIRGLVNTK